LTELNEPKQTFIAAAKEAIFSKIFLYSNKFYFESIAQPITAQSIWSEI